jgi:hypothetical protein
MVNASWFVIVLKPMCKGSLDSQRSKTGCGIIKKNKLWRNDAEMSEKNRTGSPGILWLSPDKFVFEFLGVPIELIVAERGQPLKSFECDSPIPDRLCWFCSNGISVNLLGFRGGPTCLLKQGGGDVDFCENFKPGLAFGECVKNDVGERRERAEAVFQKLRLENCGFCRYWNMEKTITTEKEDKGVERVYYSPNAGFCELRRNPRQRYCGDFRLSWDRFRREMYKKQKLRIKEYMEKIRF